LNNQLLSFTKCVPVVNRFLKVALPFRAPEIARYFAQKKALMKSGIIIFNAILLVLIAILFYLHFSTTPKKAAAPAQAASAKEPAGTNDFKIAYFDMDSLEASFAMLQDIRTEVNRKEEAINAEKAKMERNYRQKLESYQKQAQTSAMNQVQSEMATKDMMQLQQQIQARSQALEQDYQDFYTRKMKDVKDHIETYLKNYNVQKGYAYIFAYEPGLLFYYRDSTYDITADVIAGLNQGYKKK
jgi:outer membrane protein